MTGAGLGSYRASGTSNTQLEEDSGSFICSYYTLYTL